MAASRGFGLPLSLILVLIYMHSCMSVDVYTLDTSNGLGRQFHGIGAISGGGATSKLLINYPEPQRSQVLDFLFKPSFGASLHIFKVEIGGDAQSTEGTELSHMHYGWDENYHRGYEWFMMKEAKKRNPSIKLYGLPWGFPGWLGNDTRWPYGDKQRLANYVVNWVQGARDTHNLTIDYLGIWNEKPYDIAYVKTLRATLDGHGFKDIQLVVGDLEVPSAWEVTKDIAKDGDFNRTVDIIGIHYPKTVVPEETKSSHKPLWSSEDFSSYADDGGAKHWAQILNQNYVNGLMTSTIAWNILASYYDNLPIARHSLMTANQPWSGHYEVDPPIWATAHTTQFTSPGWQYLAHGRGVSFLTHGGSLVTLISPDRKNITIILETMDSTAVQNITLLLKPPLDKVSFFYTWHSQIREEYFIDAGQTKVIDSSISLQLLPNQIWTLTTLQTGYKGTYASVPPTKPFPVPYNDSFDGTPINSEANNFAQQVGAFEVVADKRDPSNHVLQQMSLQAPVHWCPLAMTQPITYFGNFNWSDIRADVSVRFPSTNSSIGIFLGAHVDQGGCYTILARGVFFFLQKQRQQIQISMDLAKTLYVAKNGTTIEADTWYRMSLIVKNTTVTALLNGQPVFSGEVPLKNKHGFLAIGTDNFGLAHFDNFTVSFL